MSPATRPCEPPDAAAALDQAEGTHRMTGRRMELKAVSTYCKNSIIPPTSITPTPQPDFKSSEFDMASGCGVKKSTLSE